MKSPRSCGPIRVSPSVSINSIPSLRIPIGPITNLQPGIAASYLYERMHKRDLRKESAEKATTIAQSTQDDLRRTLTYTLRNAFVQTLQAKAVLALAKENLEYYDKLLDLNRIRFKAGDIAEVDMDRLELQRIQYLSDIQNSTVNLRTAKIMLLQMLNDRAPVDSVRHHWPLRFHRQNRYFEKFPHHRARDPSRPARRHSGRSIKRKPITGWPKPTVPPIRPSASTSDASWATHFISAGPLRIPLRIFDRNQGEKLRTQLDITRNQHLRDATQAQVFSDVDSAYASLMGSLKSLAALQIQSYLARALKVRDTIAFSYQHGQRVAARFSECAERLPEYPTELSESGGFVPDFREPVESRRGERGPSMRRVTTQP